MTTNVETNTQLLTREQKIVLIATRTYKSSYQGRNPRFDEARRATQITRAQFDTATEELKELKLLAKNGAITEQGKLTIGWKAFYQLEDDVEIAKPFDFAPAEFGALIKMAHDAGMKAANDCKPTPMVVAQHADMLDDNSPVVKAWHVPSGVCGFAWISIKPATSAFAKYLLANDIAHVDHYAGGCSVWVHEFGQSMELKEAYASAYAKVLREHGINASSRSRID